MPFIHLPFGIDIPLAINIPAIAIVLILTLLLIKGVKESTKVATIMVGVNMFIIISFIVVGSFYVAPENWGTSMATFAPNGIEGIFSGAFITISISSYSFGYRMSTTSPFNLSAFLSKMHVIVTLFDLKSLYNILPK